jgi:septation ring formation regulator EzrA
MGHIILIAVIVVLMVIAIFRVKKEQRMEAEKREAEEIAKRTMPDGNLVPDDDELLGMTDEDFDVYSRQNLLFIINYVAYKEIDAADDDKFYWRQLFERLTRIKNLKQWW